MQLEGANRSIACSVMVLVELTGIAVEAAWDIVERLRPLAFVRADMWQSLLRVGARLQAEVSARTPRVLVAAPLVWTEAEWAAHVNEWLDEVCHPPSVGSGRFGFKGECGQL